MTSLPRTKIHPSTPLFVASYSTGLGTGMWLSEWLWQPGNGATDAIVFQGFAANFAVVFTLWCLTVFRPSGANA